MKQIGTIVSPGIDIPDTRAERIHPNDGFTISRTSAVCAFTLVELLVVMTIIAILAALLLPVLSYSKAKAQQTHCLGNLKQLAEAWTMYNGDNNGKIPSSVPFFTPGVGNSNAWVLGVSSPYNLPNPYGTVQTGILDATNQNAISRGTLFPYTRSSSIYRCAKDSRSENGVPFVRSYSMNNWMNGVPFATLDPNSRDTSHQLFTTDASLITPSQLYVFIDEDEGTINDAMFVLIMNPTEGVEDLPAHRHKTGYPLSFVDGHAETFRLINDSEDLSELRRVATRSQQRDPFPP